VPDRNQPDLRYNFRPSLALGPRHAVLSSTDQLARDVVEALGKTPPTTAEVSPHVSPTQRPELAAILKANRSTLVRSDMVNKGKSQAEAEQESMCFVPSSDGRIARP